MVKIHIKLTLKKWKVKMPPTLVGVQQENNKEELAKVAWVGSMYLNH